VRALDDLAFDNMFRQEADRPASIPRRRLRAGQGNELRLALAVEDGLNRRCFPLLADKHKIEPLRHQLLAYTSDHRDIGVERAANLFI